MSSHLFLVLSSYTLPRGTLKFLNLSKVNIEDIEKI